MLAVYRYTFFKYAKSLSTWIILFFSAIVIGFIVGGLVPFIAVKVNDNNAGNQYIRAVVSATSSVVVFLAVFASVFAGFKSATMFKDEVENGTFLLIISKPISRTTILVGKWFALQTLLIFYAIVSVFFFCMGLLAFDKGSEIASLVSLGVKPISENVGIVGVFVFVVIYMACLIFSSIGILLSTKISVAATIGIMIAIGVIIPITSLLSLFLSLSPSTPVTATNADSVNSRYLAERDRTLDFLKKNDLNKYEFNNVSVFGTNTEDVIDNLYKNYNAPSKEMVSPGDELWFYSAGRKTGDIDTYSTAWPIDFNYHFSLMAEFAYEQVVSFEKRFAANGVFQGGYSTRTEILGDHSTGNFLNTLAEYYQRTAQVSSRLAQARGVSFLVRSRGTIVAHDEALKLFDKPLKLAAADVDLIRSYLQQYLVAQGSQSNPEVQQLRNAFVANNPAVSSMPVIPIDSTNFGSIAGALAANAPATPVNTVTYTYANFEKLLNFALAISDPAQVDNFNLLDIMDYNIYLFKPAPGVVSEKNLLWLRQKLILNLGNLASRVVGAMINTIVGANTIPVPEGQPQPALKPLDADLTAWQNAVYGLNSSLYSDSAPLASNVFNAPPANNVDTILYSRLERAMNVNKTSAFKVPYFDLGRIDNFITLADRQEVVEYKVSQYADKTMILVGYLIVAIALLPIMYPLVRRQDFK